MKISRPVLVVLCSLLALSHLRATTVIPPTFAELVAQAEVIFQGTVTDVKSQWTGEGGQRHIVSYVTLNVEDTIKGDAGKSYTMQMLGGTVGDTTMEVTDTPKFKVGEREILFVEHNGTQFIPLVGIMHGRFHVEQDKASGTDVVLTDTGEAVTDVAKFGQRDDLALNKSQPADANVKSLDPEAFKSAIRAKLAQQ